MHAANRTCSQRFHHNQSEEHEVSNMNKSRAVRLATLSVALGLAGLGATAFAQENPRRAANQSMGGAAGFRMPYQTGFWGYVGAAGGRSDFEACPGVGSCDSRDTAW